MKKQLIAVGLAGLLTIPAVSFSQEMAGPGLYGSFRTGVQFGSGDSDVIDLTSRWGIKGSHEVSEGLTAAYKYEARMDTTSATSAGHRHTKIEAPDADGDTLSADTGDSGGGRLSNISLSGGFGTVTLGQIWSASGLYYGFSVDPSVVGGAVAGFGGASYRNGNSVSYSSSAGDVSFQIDKVTGDAEKVELGAGADLGPVGVNLGYSRSNVDESTFTGVAISAGAGGVNLTVGLGSSDDSDGLESDTSILHIGGALGDSGVTYAVQIIDGDAADDSDDQNFVLLTNSLGNGAKLIFEHVDPGGGADSSSLLGLVVDF